MKCQSFKFSGWHTCQLAIVIASVNNGSRGDGLDVWLGLLDTESLLWRKCVVHFFLSFVIPRYVISQTPGLNPILLSHNI